MKTLHLTKKDFRVVWFSGTGAGGQHRNKHQNCCRITHIKTGLSSIGTSSRERINNQREAFTALAKKVIAKLCIDEQLPETNKTVIRNYNKSRNEVHDKASGLKISYDIIMSNGIDEMIEARRNTLLMEGIIKESM